MLKFSFRRDRDKQFKHIAPGLIPAASIAPKPAVPRTPPPRSPNPSPERPRSALAAAILSSSLTGQTWAIPPVRPRSFSDSDRSPSLCSEPNAAAALYDRNRSEEEEQEQQEEHVYQTLERLERRSITEPIYAQAVKTKPGPELSGPNRPGTDLSGPDRPGTDLSGPDLSDPDRPGTDRPGPDLSGPDRPDTPRRSAARGRRAPSPASEQRRQPWEPSAAPPLPEHSEVQKDKRTRMGDDQRLLEERLQRLERDIGQAPPHRKPSPGGRAELQSLRQQAQELVDENDALRMTVHRLNVELSLYQSRFRPLTKQESSTLSGLPKTGPPPPWLVDMKYLSPLLLAYEDRMNERDALLQTTEEEVKRLRVRVEEVVEENERLHRQLSKRGAVSQKDCHQLQQQAVLVLQENQVLLAQLEAQHVKAKASHSRHTSEVTRLSKQLLMLEADNLRLQEELEDSRRGAQSHTRDVQGLQARLKDAVSWDEHCSIAGKLRRELQEQERRSRTEAEEALLRASALQDENRSLRRDNADLTASVRTAESQLQLCRQANRTADRRLRALKQQQEECVLKEEKTRHYLSSVISVAELISHERDCVLHMASALQQDKHRSISRMLKGAVRLERLQEEVTVYRKQASSRLAALEEAAEGQTASHQRELLHLQRLLGERREAEEKLLQSKREVEEELELVWQAAVRQNQHMEDTLVDVQLSSELRGRTQCGSDCPDRKVPALDQTSPPQAQQKHGLDYYC
ncbi:centrosomal protein of 89 kDa isoform X2 [Salarias fasciatus]|uniref:centrosomal protein of 89 kDa isoform X2 n=1 Tax=Salarias fasciatus TaxID=181472 RepID=UPI00117650AA|nr:centrosomal protein of 89 kDa isoform X2 [Salarias fasciatus]